MTVTVNAIANSASLWLMGVWPYLLGIMLLVLFLMILVFIAISAFCMLSGGRKMTFAEFDADWKRRGQPVSGGPMTFEEFDADWKRRGSPVS